MVQNIVERAERLRDLKAQVGELSSEDAGEIIFLDMSPQRKRITIYSMLTGEPVRFPAYMIPAIMQKTLPDGRFAWTGDQAKAPKYRLGQIKCFLHVDAPERPVIEELGLGGARCPAEHLANAHSKRMHARHRHKQEWLAYSEYLSDIKEQARDEQQKQQLEATLAIAHRAAGERHEGGFICQECSKEAKSNAGLQAHIRASHS